MWQSRKYFQKATGYQCGYICFRSLLLAFLGTTEAHLLQLQNLLATLRPGISLSVGFKFRCESRFSSVESKKLPMFCMDKNGNHEDEYSAAGLPGPPNKPIPWNSVCVHQHMRFGPVVRRSLRMWLAAVFASSSNSVWKIVLTQAFILAVVVLPSPVAIHKEHSNEKLFCGSQGTNWCSLASVSIFWSVQSLVKRSMFFWRTK